METLLALIYGALGALGFFVGDKLRHWLKSRGAKLLTVKIDRRKQGKTFLSMDIDGESICRPATICISNEDIEGFLDKIGADNFIDYSRDAIVPNQDYYRAGRKEPQ